MSKEIKPPILTKNERRAASDGGKTDAPRTQTKETRANYSEGYDRAFGKEDKKPTKDLPKNPALDMYQKALNRRNDK